MYQVAFANSFKKAYKKCVKRGLPVEDLQATITLLVQNGSLPPEYKPHKLQGKRKGQWECHIGGIGSDWLLVWEQHDDTLLMIMVDTSTHADIFG